MSLHLRYIKDFENNDNNKRGIYLSIKLSNVTLALFAIRYLM